MTVAGRARGEDRALVAALLGREPQGDFEVVVRTERGTPAVLCNAPFLDDGTPMPTRYWLVDPDLVRAVSRLESAGGVRQAEAELDPASVAEAHQRYAVERDAVVALVRREPGSPRPSGGVGGTRLGVKCLHAHLAWYLAGGDDPVGAWTEQHLGPPGLGAPSPPDRSKAETVAPAEVAGP
jgi:hypothetical protein